MEQKKPQEKRKYVRIDIAAKINYRIKEKGKEKLVSEKASAMSRNLSVEGICFEAERELAPGMELALQILLPADPEPLLLNGEVKWARPIEGKGKPMFEIGVKLCTFGESDENRYLRYVSEKMMERLSRYLHL